MASPYPGRIPDLLTTDSPDVIFSDPPTPEKFVSLIGHVQAAMDTLGPNPQGEHGSVGLALAALEAMTAGWGRSAFATWSSRTIARRRRRSSCSPPTSSPFRAPSSRG